MKPDDAPWLNEPDFLRWIDPATGLRCAIVRNEFALNLLGYVRVPPGAFRKRLQSKKRIIVSDFLTDRQKARNEAIYNKSVLRRIRVHGGLTFSGRHRHYRLRDGGLWLGFDCAHAWDLSPGLEATLDELYAKRGETRPSAAARDMTYRTVEYVREECTRLAAQISALIQKGERHA